MRHLAITLLLALATAFLPAAAHASDVPDTVTRLAQAWLAQNQSDFPNVDPVQVYASNFFSGYTNPGGSDMVVASRLVRDAVMAGRAYWREHPDEREGILAGFGYERIEIEGTWTRAFEISGFAPRDSRGLWWLSPLEGAIPPDAPEGQARVRISGYLSRPGQYGHLGMYKRELLASTVVFIDAPAAVPPLPPVARSAARLQVDSCSKPAYPMKAVRDEMEGTVHFSLLVDKEGAVVESKMLRSSGHRELDQATLAAFTRCKFTPAQVDGLPEQAWLSMSYTFSLAPPLPVPARY